jgi:pheromone shutdown protein TraB
MDDSMGIILVGVGHVFSIKDAIRYIILKYRPDVVCIELDRMRFEALESGMLHDADAPFIIKRLQKVYEKAAATQGAEIGEEMLAGVEAAKELGVPHIFIDLDASPMVMSLIDNLTMGQKLKLAGQVLTASVLPQNYLEEGIRKVQENPDEAMAEFEKAFPTLKRDIVDMRDDHMAKRIREVSQTHSLVLSIVGEGHIPGIMKKLNDMGPMVIHLNEVMRISEDLQNGKLRSQTHSVGFTVVIDYEDGSV